MPLALAIPLFVPMALAIAAGIYASIALWKIAGAIRRFPTLADRCDAPPPPSGWPLLTIIIPAHNEADVIAEVARSVLASDYPALRVVFALDRCTDATHATLQRAIDEAGSSVPAEIITVSHCPDEWAGKVHALHHALATSSAARDAPLLLFLDADCQLTPSCLRSAVTLMHEHDLDMLSVLSRLIAVEWYERIVQPIAAFELIRQYPPHRVNADLATPRDPATGLLPPKHRAWPFANGQFILVRREAYDRIDGHRSVRGELLEDIAIAKRFARTGHRIAVFLSGGELRCRMYRSWPAFQRGWKRIYTEAAKRRPNRLATNLRAVFITKAILPLAGPACLGVGILAAFWRDWPLALAALSLGTIATALFQRMIAVEHREQGLPCPMPWTVARAGWHTARILREAQRDLAAGNDTEWGGKRYARRPNTDQLRATPPAPPSSDPPPDHRPATEPRA